MGKLGCWKVGQPRDVPQVPVSGTKSAPSLSHASTHATQHKGRPSPTGAVSCHTLTFWARSLASATGTVRRDLHLGRRTLANEMCLLLPASSPNGAKLPFGADKEALPSGATRVQRAWRWSLGTWAQSPSSTTGARHRASCGSADASCTQEGRITHGPARQPPLI